MKRMFILVLLLAAISQLGWAADSDCEALLRQYSSLIQRMATTHVDSGGSIALKILATNVKRKLISLGVSENELLDLGKSTIETQAVEVANAEQVHLPLTILPTPGTHNIYNSLDGKYIGYASFEAREVAIFANGDYENPVFETEAYMVSFTNTNDGKYLILHHQDTNSSQRANVYEVGTWKLVYKIEGSDYLNYPVVLTLDQRHILVTTLDRRVRLIDLHDFSVTNLNPEFRFSRATTAIVSQDNHYLFAADGVNSHGGIIFDLVEDKLVKEIVPARLYLVDDPDYIGLDLPEKSVLEIGTWRITPAESFYDPSKLYTSILDPERDDPKALITPDRRFLISIEENVVSIADIETKLFHYRWAAKGKLGYARITPDGKYLLTVWQSGEVHAVDINAAKEAYSYAVNVDQGDRLIFSVTAGGEQILIATYRKSGIHVIDHARAIKHSLIGKN